MGERTVYTYRASYGDSLFGGLSHSKAKAIMKCRRAALAMGDQAVGYVRVGTRIIYRCRAGLNKVGRLTLTVEDIPQ